MASVKSQIEQKFDIPRGQLKAVVFYSDRSYSHSLAYGPYPVTQRIRKNGQELGGQTRLVEAFLLSELTIVPTEGYVVDGTTFGLQGGNILLVPYIPK